MKKVTVAFLISIIISTISLSVYAFSEIWDNNPPSQYSQYHYYIDIETMSGSNKILQRIYSNKELGYTDFRPTYDAIWIITKEETNIRTLQFNNILNNWQWTGNEITLPTNNTIVTLGTYTTDNWQIVKANYEIADYDPNNSDYYIYDQINFFQDGDILEIMDIERKFEQNLRMQFFIRTVEINDINSSDWSNVSDYITTKSPTGNGSISFGIEKNNAQEVVRIYIAQSANASVQDPASRYMYDFFDQMQYAQDVTPEKFIKVLENIYQDLLLQDSWEKKEFGNYVDNPIRNNSYEYQLKNSKIPLYENVYAEENYVADGKSLIFRYKEGYEPEEPIEEEPSPTEPTIINPPAPPEGEDPTGGNEGLLAALWAVIKALFGLIASFFKMISNVIEKAFTFKNAEATSDLFNAEMILGIQFFKNVEIPQLNMKLINVFEAAFAAVGLFVLVRIGQKVLSLFNKG